VPFVYQNLSFFREWKFWRPELSRERRKSESNLFGRKKNHFLTSSGTSSQLWFLNFEKFYYEWKTWIRWIRWIWTVYSLHSSSCVFSPRKLDYKSSEFDFKYCLYYIRC
jgi:hypothetical protein